MAKKVSRPDTIKFLIIGAMARKRIDTRRELCSYLSFDETCLSRKINGETCWMAADIRDLHKILRFTPEELETFVMCAYSRRELTKY